MKKYNPLMDLKQTEEAILVIKHHFQRELAEGLNLYGSGWRKCSLTPAVSGR